MMILLVYNLNIGLYVTGFSSQMHTTGKFLKAFNTMKNNDVICYQASVRIAVDMVQSGMISVRNQYANKRV